MNTETAWGSKVWESIFQDTNVWIVQAAQSETFFARKTAGGLLRLFSVLERYPHRVLLTSSHETPSFRLIEDATYPGVPLLHESIPNNRMPAHTSWPSTVSEDALLIVDTLSPRWWNTFQTWRGQRAALVILEVDSHHGWIPPNTDHWVLNVPGTYAGREYHAPAFSESDPDVMVMESGL